MTIFMGPRTAYQVSRYEYHSKFAWATLIAVVLMCLGPFSLKGEESRTKAFAYSTTSLIALSLLSGNGRRMIGKLTHDTFYGCLFTFTGVFEKRGGNNTGNR